MKITWFAALTCRIHIAGQIVVTNPDGAPEGVDASELVAGAQVVASAASAGLAAFDALNWRPRKRGRLIDEDTRDPDLTCYRLGERGLVADSASEGQLVIADSADAIDWGVWAHHTVIVLSGNGEQCAKQGKALLAAARPKLVALAVSDEGIDVAFDALVPHLGDASLVVLEAGLAVEV